MLQSIQKGKQYCILCGQKMTEFDHYYKCSNERCIQFSIRVYKEKMNNK